MTGLETLPVRFQSKIRVLQSGCWEWTSGRTKDGYGKYTLDGKTVRAHRVSFLLTSGTIPDGLILDHFLYPGRCIGPLCVLPDHLRPVTWRENVLRAERSVSAIAASRTACPQGHPYDEQNTYRYPNRNARACRICMRDANRRQHAKRMAV